MNRKILMATILLLSLNASCFAYNDYGYSYGVGGTNNGGFDSSMHLREMQNDFDRQQALNQPSLSATCNQGSRYFQQEPARTTSNSYTPSRNPDRDYVQSKPLSLKGIYAYDGYGR